MKNTYDYIIVGAGSAGCILADRLSESGKYTVLVLESGGSDNSFWFKIPVGFAKMFYNPSYNWMFYSEPEKELNNRKLYCPLGKVQGGSGSINAMIYMRGLRQDFDDWANEGNEGWSADEVLPYFKKLESHPLGDTEYHSSNGRMRITSMKDGAHPICNNYLDACRELGHPVTDDFNGSNPEGAGIYDINVRDGKRDSSSFAYLNRAKKRKNLELILKAEVNKVLFNKSKTATGVSYVRKGRHFLAQARREVILSCGTVHTPKLLQLSGVGNRKLLRNHSIPLVHELPAVGENLQDHLCVSFLYKSNVKTLNDILGSLWGQAKAGLQYLLSKKGPLMISVNQAGGFFPLHDNALDDRKRSYIQTYFNPLSYQHSKPGTRMIKPNPYSGFLVAYNSCRPTSRGTVSIASTDPKDPPIIRPNYLSTEKDVKEAILGGKFIRKLIATQSLNKITLQEVLPGNLIQTNPDPNGTDTEYDQSLLKFFKENASSIYHLCGTCRMGPDPKNSVVSDQLRVHGINNLRIIDASIFPNITSGNINAPTMMVAEKGADMILSEL